MLSHCLSLQLVTSWISLIIGIGVARFDAKDEDDDDDDEDDDDHIDDFSSCLVFCNP
jgi:hypothetical protein